MRTTGLLLRLYVSNASLLSSLGEAEASALYRKLGLALEPDNAELLTLGEKWQAQKRPNGR